MSFSSEPVVEPRRFLAPIEAIGVAAKIPSTQPAPALTTSNSSSKSWIAFGVIDMQGSNRWADKSTSFHATTKSATSGFTSPALAAKKANQKNLRPTSRNSPKHNVLDALIRSENANWRNNAKQDHLGRQTQNCRRQQFNKGSIRSPSY